MEKVQLTEGAKSLINDCIAPFIEENQDLMLDDKYFTGYYRDTVEDGNRNIRPIFDFDSFLIPIVCKVCIDFCPYLPELVRKRCIGQYLLELKDYLDNNNKQILIRIRNHNATSDENSMLLFYFNLDLNLPLVVNTCYEFLL